MENLIPNVEKKISLILEKLNLKPESSPKEFIKKTKGNKHRYLSVCATGTGKRLVFYARLHKNPDAQRKMINEISFLRTTKEKKTEISKYFPEFYKGKIGKDFEWFTREYLKGLPLGTNEQLRKEIRKKDIPLLVEAIYLINRTPPSLFQNVPLRKFSVQNYIDSQNSISYLKESKIFKGKSAEKMMETLKENRILLQKENKYFAHGDFNLGNLIIEKGSLKILDWESIQINNFAFDIAYLFTHLWQEKKSTRKKIIETYLGFLLKKERMIFKKIFPIVIFYLAIGGLDAKPIEISSSFLKKRKEFFKKLLKNTALGFGQLINS